MKREAGLRQATHVVQIQTRGRGFHDLTPTLREWVERQGFQEGLLTLFLRHTSASLLIQENADPDVQRDLEAFFSRLVKDGDPLFRHDAEGPDDMPSHVRAALTQTQLSIPLMQGQLALGTWQAVYLWEHRTHGHRRSVALHLLGSGGPYQRGRSLTFS